jgi:phage terminase large subunit-like protein
VREQSIAEIVVSSAEERTQLYGLFKTPELLEFLKIRWPFFVRSSQLPPSGSWSNWLILTGRGVGRPAPAPNGCAPICAISGRGRAWRHVALVAETAADARAVEVGDGKGAPTPPAGSGIRQVHPKDYRPIYESSKRRLT